MTREPTAEPDRRRPSRPAARDPLERPDVHRAGADVDPGPSPRARSLRLTDDGHEHGGAHVIRLTGLPEPARFGRAVVEQGAGVVRIVFSGSEGTRVVEVPLAYVGGDDLEATLLRLLANLADLGYDPSWRRKSGS